MADLSVVMDKLQGFENSDDLAEFFRGYGIVAQPRNARACAITKFVMEETGLVDVVTNQTTVAIYKSTADYECGETSHSFDHTDAMEEFVERYDNGDYEDLVEPGYTVAELETESCSCPSCGDN